ncbi:MAG: methionyl-tRNA formyltransferase [Chloroflexota bacterium]
MRLALIGQAAFGEAVFKALRERGEEVVVVCAPEPRPGARPDPLWAAAEAAGVPVLPTRGLRRDEAVIQRFFARQPELGVMAYVTEIIPERVLFGPPLGTIQYHPSLLPKHRGASAINWAIMQGETKTGLTIFWPDRGIDTGPILLQKEVEIGPDDTVASLYFNKLFPLGVEALVEAVELVKQGKAPRIEQDHSQATYEPICRDEHTWIAWDADPARVYNLIRGANPTPGANATFRGAQIKIFDSARTTAPRLGAPGEILDITSEGVVVALASGALLIKRVQVPGQPKVAASEWARAVEARPGERFAGRGALGELS